MANASIREECQDNNSSTKYWIYRGWISEDKEQRGSMVDIKELLGF
jgi:hypothetical protein